jgi:hypothetical protein
MLRIQENTSFDSGSYGALYQVETVVPGDRGRMRCHVCLDCKAMAHGQMIYRPCFTPRPPVFTHDYEWVCFACIARIGTEEVGSERFKAKALKARA